MTKLIDTHVRNLPCKLTTDQLLAKSKELSHVLREKSSLEATHKNRRDQMKQEMSEIDARIGRIGGIVYTGEEYRDVKVEVYSGDNETIQVKRVDTGEIIDTHQANPEELQLKLEMEPKAIEAAIPSDGTFVCECGQEYSVVAGCLTLKCSECPREYKFIYPVEPEKTEAATRDITPVQNMIPPSPHLSQPDSDMEEEASGFETDLPTEKEMEAQEASGFETDLPTEQEARESFNNMQSASEPVQEPEKKRTRLDLRSLRIHTPSGAGPYKITLGKAHIEAGTLVEAVMKAFKELGHDYNSPIAAANSILKQFGDSDERKQILSILNPDGGN